MGGGRWARASILGRVTAHAVVWNIRAAAEADIQQVCSLSSVMPAGSEYRPPWRGSMTDRRHKFATANGWGRVAGRSFGRGRPLTAGRGSQPAAQMFTARC